MAHASNTEGKVTEPSLIAFIEFITYLRENKERKSLSPKINATCYISSAILINLEFQLGVCKNYF